MKTTTLLALAAATPALATYVCPVMPGTSDQAAIAFGYAIQELLNSYYESVPINQTFYSTLPSPTVPMTDFLANTMGLGVQAKIGSDALMALGQSSGIMAKPQCDFTYPPVTNASSHLMNAYMIEATLCGAFIGLADYVESPQAAFLMARLAAEHGTSVSFPSSCAIWPPSCRAPVHSFCVILLIHLPQSLQWLMHHRDSRVLYWFAHETHRLPRQQHRFDPGFYTAADRVFRNGSRLPRPVPQRVCATPNGSLRR